jgi:ribosomal protein S18 acetylase RimI-like enzyme
MSADLVGEWHTLRSGKEVLVRPIRPDDKRGMVEAFERMSPESRYRRFFSPTPRLTGKQLRYLTEVDHHGHEALLAVDPRTRDGLGIGRFIRSSEDPTVAEVAVAVVDDWQGRGLATALLHDLSARARQEGISQFRASVLAHNEEALDLFRHMADARVTGTEHGIVELIMDIPEEGIPEALRHAVRAAASGDVEHPGGP